ncbi:MAG: YkgJ family cysteine cluster protein [Candidatus Heimdallarchaeota archaeon]
MSENDEEKELKKVISGENGDQEPSEPEPVSDSERESPQKKKYVFNCTKCGQCCENRPFLPITLADVQAWAKTGTLNAVLPHLRIQSFKTSVGEGEQQPQEFVSLVLKGTEDNHCPMYDATNKLCNVYHSLPLECKAFPLGYNGKNYYIKDKSVPGLGNGTMTKERLIEDRNAAKADFDARIDSQVSVSILYSLFMQSILEQQRRVMDEMPEDKRKQLDELLKSTDPKTE